MDAVSHTLPFLLFLSGFLFLTVQWLLGFLQGRRIVARLARAIPHPIANAGVLKGSSGHGYILNRAMYYIDPSAGSSETALKNLGVSDNRRLALIGLGRIVIAASAALFTASLIVQAQPSSWLIYGLIPGVFALTLTLFSMSLRWASENRQKRVHAELIFGLDLLIIFLESGLSLSQSLKSFAEVSARATPALQVPQRGLITDIENGIPYDRALNLWIERLGCPEGRPIAALFLQSLTHGTELVPQLKQITTELTEQRLFAARESIGVKAAQMTILMVFFFLPSLLGLIAGPPILSILQSFGTQP